MPADLQAVADFPEVMECYLMTGECDYQLRVLDASLAEFEDFLRQKLTRVEGVSQVTSSFALRPVVYRTAIPLRRRDDGVAGAGRRPHMERTNGSR